MDSKDGLDVVAKRKFLLLSGVETQPSSSDPVTLRFFLFSSFHITFLPLFPSFVFQQSGLIS